MPPKKGAGGFWRLYTPQCLASQLGLTIEQVRERYRDYECQVQLPDGTVLEGYRFWVSNGGATFFEGLG